MKYMKIGILPDTFHTEAAARTVLSDVPSDLTIHIKNTKYRLHKFPLLLKCGLLQRLCSDSDDTSEISPIPLHDIPGGEEAFETCAKFCYGIAINLSAHNFIPVLCAAKYLKMTESVAKGNFVIKLEMFFESCILHGWKDSIVTLQETQKFPTLSESIGIVHRCASSIIQKILTHPSQVTWSYTYTRPGYEQKNHQSVPKDWWTEDVSDLELDQFRSIISAVRSSKQILPALIGEALHVYACKHLLDPVDIQRIESSSNRTEEMLAKQRRVLESIVSMIPIEHGSVSGSFLLRLLKVSHFLGASPSTKAELVRRAGRQLHEATTKDLLFPSPINPQSYDIDLVEAVLEIFLMQFRRPLTNEEADNMIALMRRVAKTVDSYLQTIACDPDIPVSKITDIAQSLPELARPQHDDLYRVINTYLKEHPDISKSEKKQLCQILDCSKLSAEARSHAIKSDRLPLRTIVQVLFIEQGKTAGQAGSSQEMLGRPPTADQIIGNLQIRENFETSQTSIKQGQQGIREGHSAESIPSMKMAKSRSLAESKATKKKDGLAGKEEGKGSKTKSIKS